MCEALRKLNHDPIFLSAIGHDLFGRELEFQFQAMNIDHSKIRKLQCSSAIYSALLNHSGECLFGMGDMSIHDKIGSDYIQEHATLIETAPIVIVDGNIPVGTISKVLEICSFSKTPVWFEPTEIRKSQKICMTPTDYRRAVSFLSPNIHELQSILKVAYNDGQNVHLDNRMRAWTFKDKILTDNSKTIPEELNLLSECFHVFTGLEMVLLTKGKDGILVAFKDKSSGHLDTLAYPAPCISPRDVVSVSGAGDCLNAGFISSILQGCSWMECARIGTEYAKQSLNSLKNVPDSFFFSSN